MKIQWKCSLFDESVKKEQRTLDSSKCGYQFEGEPTPPDRCPSCKGACAFIDATCYIPECEGPEGRDRRI